MMGMKTWRPMTGLILAGLVVAGFYIGSASDALADSASAAPDSPTYTRDVAPIFNTHCVQCHRVGDIAPMSMMNYDEVRPWAKSIRKEVAALRMPPWHAAEGIGEYSNDASLTDIELSTILRWVDTGAPAGDPADMPDPPTFSSDWRLGEPDLIVTMPVQFELGPEGDDVYQCFIMPPVPEDTWVQAIEFKPGNRAIDHHVVLFLDGTGEASAHLDAATPEPGYPCYGSPLFLPSDILAVWAPGTQPDVLPEGIARAMPKGSRIVMQMHYHRNGKLEIDRSSVGLHFAEGPVRKRLHVGTSIDFTINIASGETDYVSRASWKADRDVEIRALFPHMHVLGKTIGMTAYYPDGASRALLEVPRYDFDWQRTYYLSEPVNIAAGTRIETRAIYDNSAGNPNNPSSPPRPVRFGFDTFDEMNVGFVYYTNKDEDLTMVDAAEAFGGSGFHINTENIPSGMR